MTQIDIAAMQTLLENERIEVEHELAAHGKHVGDRPDNWVGSTEGTDAPDTSDRNIVADQIEELVENVSIVETLERRLRDIEYALQKIKDGTYGICEVSGKPIPPERLRANPAARTLVEYADKQ